MSVPCTFLNICNVYVQTYTEPVYSTATNKTRLQYSCPQKQTVYFTAVQIFYLIYKCSLEQLMRTFEVLVVRLGWVRLG